MNREQSHYKTKSEITPNTNTYGQYQICLILLIFPMRPWWNSRYCRSRYQKPTTNTYTKISNLAIDHQMLKTLFEIRRLNKEIFEL